jgi:enoyl-CoA hydratase/carnithine racemase
MYQEILYQVEDPVATITLNRPDRLNAFTQRMDDELKHAVARAEADPNAVAIVLTGAGRGFCAGADVQRLKRIGEGETTEEGANLPADPGDPEMDAGFRGPHSYLLSVRKPIIAAINGPTAGLGFAIAMFCDMRFASDRAIFTTAFSRRGLIAEWGIGWTLPRLIGTAHALDLLLSARRFDAAEADRVGLVNRVLPHDELLPFVRDEASGLHQSQQGSRRCHDRGHRADGGELLARRLQGRRPVLPGQAPTEVQAGVPRRRRITISVISEGANRRIGGPQKPDPRLT